MTRGIRIRAWHPLDRTHIYDLGNQYNDSGPAKFLSLKTKYFVIQQGFVNNDDPANKMPFNIDFQVHGSGFKYTAFSVPYAGIVRKISIKVDGALAYEFSKLDLAVPKLAKWYASDDPFGKLQKLLKHNDKIFGSIFNDPDIYGGRGNDKLYGKDGDDTLDGAKGDDLSDGGYGNDYLKDSKGHNTFQFSTMLSATMNLDTIHRFRAGDEIYLSHSIFPAIGNKLDKIEFVIGTAAQDHNDHIIWNPSTHTASYDPDGVGGMSAIPFFMTENNAHITYKSFEVGVLLDY
ncbi:MAG: hypothetical protein KDJ88_06810 [Bauldia sp.]|nr:hypothetical protein [Bauldia sp.]